MTKIILYLLIICKISLSYGQQSKENIIVRVLDSESNPIPFVNVYDNCGFGTMTNEQGYFSYSRKLSCSTIYLSHINFQLDSIESNLLKNDYKVTLANKSILLDEVVVKPFNVRQFLKKAYERLQKDRAHSYKNSTGYYKQITRNNEKIVEYLEMINNYQYSNRGINKWSIKNGRYANDTTNVFTFKNFSVYIREVLKIYGEKKVVAFPLSKFMDNYNFKYAGEIDSTHIVIEYELSKRNRRTLLPLKGNIIIDDENYNIVQFTGYFNELIGVKKTYFPYKLKNQGLKFVISYKEGEYNYAQANSSFEIYKFGRKEHSIAVNSIFVNLNDTISKLDENIFRNNSSDLEQIKSKKYNSELWSNPIIKRLEDEERTLKLFEDQKLFENKE